VVRNENERLYSKFNLRARVGFLSQWLEFHAQFGGGGSTFNQNGVSLGNNQGVGGHMMSSGNHLSLSRLESQEV
jgi:hypothetical protein